MKIVACWVAFSLGCGVVVWAIQAHAVFIGIIGLALAAAGYFLPNYAPKSTSV